MTVRIVPMEGAGQAPPVAVTTLVDDTTLMAEATADALTEKETLPEPEPPTAQEPIAETMVALIDIQIPKWNLGERILIAPQVWDANTPQMEVGAAEADVDIVNLEESELTPATPETVRKSPKEKQKSKRRRSAEQETDGQLVIRLKTTGSTRPADAAEVNERPGGTANIVEPATVHSAVDGADLATAVVSVQEPTQPVPGTDEVQLIDGIEPVVETVDAPTSMIEDHTPEEESAWVNTDTEQETIQVSSPSTPISTAATVNVAGEIQVESTVREQTTEIMMMLETAMLKVCAWSERIEAQTSETAERDVKIWKRRLENCEESLKRKSASLSEAEKR
jgi:hypothetical protein